MKHVIGLNLMGAAVCLWVQCATPRPQPSAQAAAESTSFFYLRALGSDGDSLRAPTGLAVASDGTLFVAERGWDRVLRISYAERTYRVWGGRGSAPGQFRDPRDIALDSSGQVYVADPGNYRIQKFTAQGDYVTTWGSSGTGHGQFGSVGGIAISPEGYLFVADSANHRIQVFDLAGGFVRTWGSQGDLDGQFAFPTSVAVGIDGNIYVADTYHSQIQVFSPNGVFLRKLLHVDAVIDLAVDAQGALYTVADMGGRFDKFSSTGEPLGSWGTRGSVRASLTFRKASPLTRRERSMSRIRTTTASRNSTVKAPLFSNGW